MFELSLIALLIALVLDWFFGEPDFIWSRLPHPVVLFGKVVGYADRRFNRIDDAPDDQVKKGALAISLLIFMVLLAGVFLNILVHWLGWFGLIFELFVIFVLLAQRSLYDHVCAVADSLRNEGIEGGRKAVGLIVGRDPELLDKNGICRAAIESLAENFSDGVVAPVFWYLVFGLPGLLVYKMINTADSMIAYRNEKYLYFGKTAAQIDDFANWLPARLSAGLIAAGAAFENGIIAGKTALTIAFRDSGLHRSPNAGWPEAAMAGGANIALGGPRIYAEETVQQAYLNGAGQLNLDETDIHKSLMIFSKSCFALWVFVLLMAVIF